MTAQELAARLSLPEALQQQVFYCADFPNEKSKSGMSCFFAIKKLLNCACAGILRRNSWRWLFICAGPLRPITVISPLEYPRSCFLGYLSRFCTLERRMHAHHGAAGID